MREAESRIAEAARTGVRRWASAGRCSRFLLTRHVAADAPRPWLTPASFGLVGGFLAMILLLGASPASGAYLHTTVIGEYGKEGPKATGVSGGCNLDFHSATNRIYYFADQKIYGLERTGPGTVVPLGGSFPINAGINSSCGDRDLAVDNSGQASSGNIYAVPSNTSIYGWSPAGNTLPSFPVNVGGETCGVAVNNEGQVWGGDYANNRVAKYTASGTLIGTIPVGIFLCKLAIDPTNNDLYAAPYNSGAIAKFTASSGYTTKINFPSSGTNNPGLAINGATNRLYVAGGSTVKSYDTSSGSLVETITPGGSASSVAVDEATDTLFVAPTDGAIKEISGAIVPDVVTGEAEGNSKVNGLVDPAGGGEVIECYFEFGTTTSYGSKEFCSPATPYNANQAVFANLPGLLGEVTYHYRLVAHNANGKNFGADKTITPHYVVGLKTEDAENVARSTATLKASFEGNGEETHYYFEWGPTTAYGTKSAVPPGDSAGSPTAPPVTYLTFNASGLQPDTTYHYRVVATNALGTSPGNDRTFKSLPAIQSLTTEPASNVARRSATLNASYLGDGDATSYKFEWGKTTSYGYSTPQDDAGTPSGPTVLSADLSDLELETTYHYRVVATNSLGTTKGGDQTFTTHPAVAGVVTQAATDISHAIVSLHGEFTGNGEDTHYYFEYGPTPEYGTVTAEPPGADAGAPGGPTPLSAVIDDFEGYTTYHYRLVASNQVGVTYGNDETFTTLPALFPGVQGTTALNVGSTSAVLEAEVNPNRWMTVFAFEYGPTSAYGESTRIGGLIDGHSIVSHRVSAQIEDLTPGTMYHFRTVAINFAGTTHGPDATFITPDAPRVDSTFSSSVGRTSAHLGALVAGNGNPTTVRFEYGTTTSYGASTGAVAIGSDLRAREAGAEVGGLRPGTTYHFRAVATNGVGTAYGLDRTLTTAAALPDGVEQSNVNCKKLGRLAKRKRRRAEQFRGKARKSAKEKRTRALRRRATRLSKEAGKLSARARACRRASGGSGK